MMSSAVILIAFCVVLVFWALGAYNRLVRLRATVGKQLHLLVSQWQAQAQTVGMRLEQYAGGKETESQWATLDEDALRWRPLTLAARQFLACLTALHASPQALASIDDVSAVWAARNIFEANWQRLGGEQEDLAGAPIPPDLQILWAQHEPGVQERMRDYNDAVQKYHQAIQQFPALLIAGVFGFRMTAPLA